MSHRSGANPPTTTGSAAAVQADAQLFDKAVQPIERGGSGFDRPGEQWPGDCHHIRAQCDHLGRIHAGADAPPTTGSDQRMSGSAARTSTIACAVGIPQSARSG